MGNPSRFRHDPRALSQALFDRAKRSWGWALLCQVGLWAGGLSLIWVEDKSWKGLVTVAALVLSATAWALLKRRDAAKDAAEALLCKLDLKDSFGWGISGTEMSDLLAELPRRVARALPSESLGGEYFASKRPAGAPRSMENLEESAWWSKHLSRYMARYCVVGSLLLFCVPVLILLVGAQISNDAAALSVIAQIVVSVFTLVFALDAVGAALSYREFRGKAERAEARARDVLSSGPVDEIAAVKTMQEYHVARATAPLLLSSVWRLHRGRLNELWDDYRAGR